MHAALAALFRLPRPKRLSANRGDQDSMMKIRAFACVFLTAVLLYAHTIRFGYIGYDDTLLVIDNQEFLRDLSNAPRAFLQDAFQVPGYNSSNAYYRPVMTLSLMADAQLGGTDPLVHHIDNTLQHAIASCLVLACLLALGYALLPAALMSIFFAVHPAFAGVAAWVPGRVDALLTIYALAATLLFIEGVRRKRTLFLALHVSAYALAAFTKEIGILLPIPLAILAWTDHARGATAGRLPRVKGVNQRAAWIPAGWAAVFIAWFFVRRSAVTAPQAVTELFTQLGGNLPILVNYLGKAIIPARLSPAPTIADTPLVFGIAAAALLAAAIAFSRQKRPARVILGIVWFLVFALPPLIVPRIVGLEQRLYLPMIGILILLLETDLPRWIERRRAALGVAIAVLALFAGIAWTRAGVYRSRAAFWTNAVATAPHNSYARASLGAVYMSRNQMDEAWEEYLRAVELNPIEPKANGNLGVIAARRGRIEEARGYLRKEIESNPDYPDAYFNLGQTYAQAGETGKAAELWEETLRVRPDHHDALRLLAQYYASVGQKERAAEYGRRLAALREPKTPPVK
jgi:protein O-mannosyl-transferase